MLSSPKDMVVHAMFMLGLKDHAHASPLFVICRGMKDRRNTAFVLDAWNGAKGSAPSISKLKAGICLAPSSALCCALVSYTVQM